VDEHSAYLGLGSNLGKREAHLSTALEKISNFAVILAKSGIYETEPWGLKEQPNFLNQVIWIKTLCEPMRLLDQLKSIEKEMGRKRTVRYGPRPIDLDILFYDELILQTEKLSIPHPMLSQRAFVLVPLAEIAPSLVHPVEKKTITKLLEQINRSSVWQWKGNE
jgi:2-amino-4-hydroxy-6-hydroxymethyldihydropteridine diphosphokinase